VVNGLRLEELIKIDPKSLAVKSRESLHREFKELFNTASLPKYAKTIAAMANTDGGYIYFGIADRPNRIVGCDPETIPDSAVLSDSLNNWFEPHVNVEIIEFEYSDLKVVAFKILESQVKPVICKKNATVVLERTKRGKVERNDKTVLSEGAIYRRYAGKTQQIRFAELHEIFLERDRIIYSALLENMKSIQRIGVERVGIADVSAMSTGGDISRIYLSKEAIKNLNLIDKGKFVETEAEGDTSYFVAGTVKLHETTEVPVDDADRIKPGVVASSLSEDARRLLFPTFRLSYTHLAKYARQTEIRVDTEQYDNRYCKWDEQAQQWFYREAFVRHLKKSLVENPRDTLEKLSAKQNLEEFDRYHKVKDF
jgi:hypothetical protein